MKVLIKIGGSLITKKSTKEFPTNLKEIKQRGINFINLKKIHQIASQISKAFDYVQNLQLIVINGAGPFGHYLVDRYIKFKDIVIEDVHESVKFLNKIFSEEFKKSNLNLMPIHPFETCRFDGQSFLVQKLFNRTKKILKENKTPSSYGDIVKSDVETHLGKFTIISGDDLIVELTKLWNPNKIILATDVDGVYTSNPHIDKKAKPIKKISIKEGIEGISFEKTKIDVTGGMGAKIKKLFKIAELGYTSIIINGEKKNRILNSILGKKTKGTIICP